MKKLRAFQILASLFLGTSIFAEGIHEEGQSSQENKFTIIGPMIAFGENILKKGEVEYTVLSDAFVGNNSYLIDAFPGIIYGIRDDFSLALYVPFSPRNKVGPFHSSGFEDLIVQFEYAFFTKKTSYARTQATIVAAFLFPTGSIQKIPATGHGSSSYFVGTTISTSLTDWMFFTSHGILLPTAKDEIKSGKLLFYQGGFGKNIATPKDWVFAFMLELNGFYSWKGRIGGDFNPDSGGNLLFLTPSIWISKKTATLQFGVGYPLIQNLNGMQPRQYALVGLNIGIVL